MEAKGLNEMPVKMLRVAEWNVGFRLQGGGNGWLRTCRCKSELNMPRSQEAIAKG